MAAVSRQLLRWSGTTPGAWIIATTTAAAATSLAIRRWIRIGIRIV